MDAVPLRISASGSTRFVMVGETYWSSRFTRLTWFVERESGLSTRRGRVLFQRYHHLRNICYTTEEFEASYRYTNQSSWWRSGKFSTAAQVLLERRRRYENLQGEACCLTTSLLQSIHFVRILDQNIPDWPE